MNEPTKLFATRAERYPEPAEADVAQGAARAVLAAIPLVGGSITEVLSMVLAPAVIRRRDEWLKELADALDRLEAKVEGFRTESLVDNEVFVSAVIQATRTAVGTHQGEKRECLRNALLNIAFKEITDEKQAFFLSLIDTFTITHLRLLKLFSNPPGFPSEQRIQLREQRFLTNPIVADLHSRGLLSEPDQYHPADRQAYKSLTDEKWKLTPLGLEFLNFVATPEPLK